MTTFDSTKASLNDLLKEIKEGKLQLPDFQRIVSAHRNDGIASIRFGKKLSS